MSTLLNVSSGVRGTTPRPDADIAHPINEGTAASTADAPVPLARVQSRWLMALARRPALQIGWACAAPLIGGALLIVQAWLLARVLNDAVVTQSMLAQAWPVLAGIGALMVARAGLTWTGERAGAAASEHIKYLLRAAFFDRMMAHGPSWSRDQASGELAGSLIEQIESLDGFFAKYLPAMVAATVLPIVFAVAVMPMDVVAGLLLLCTAPLIPLFMALIGWRAQSASRKHFRAMTRLSGFFVDRLRGAATLKLFGQERAEAATVKHASEGLCARTMSVLRIAFMSSAVLEFFAALGVAGMAVYFGLTFLGFLDLRGTPLTLHIGLFCLIMAPEAYAPLRQFAAHYHDRATAQAAVAELSRVFSGLPDVDPVDPRQSMAEHGEAAVRPAGWMAGLSLAVNGATLRYAADGPAVLHDVHWHVPAGARVALMGASGSGKTTLLDTLARLRPSLDCVWLDGEPIEHWDDDALRAAVAYIGQRPYLFDGTLIDNIRLGRASASDEEVMLAAQRACVTTFSDLMPAGLATPIGARGRGLSGGQAHRVALARLYLRQPAVILVDEPTAHLDSDTAQSVMDGLLDFARGRTLVVTTHAPAVAARCSSIYRIHDSRVVPA